MKNKTNIKCYKKIKSPKYTEGQIPILRTHKESATFNNRVLKWDLYYYTPNFKKKILVLTRASNGYCGPNGAAITAYAYAIAVCENEWEEKRKKEKEKLADSSPAKLSPISSIVYPGILTKFAPRGPLEALVITKNFFLKLGV